MAMVERIDLNKPVWDQSTFEGRFKYFAWITDPFLTVTSTAKLLDAKDLLEKYRRREEPPGTTLQQVRCAQQLVLSAFHPDSGDLQNVVGRMSFQVPGGMVLIGAMITFYKSSGAVLFWQWTNQSFNALVNYTNRNAEADISVGRLVTAYISATSCAVVTALGLKKVLATRGPPLVQRLVPFAAVAAANCVNIPLMRQSELLDGVTVCDENGNKVGTSSYAAAKGISQVIFCRILMAAPSMTLLPVLMQRLEKMAFLQRLPILAAPLQILITGATLLVMTPTCCALFPQQCSVSTQRLKQLEPERYMRMEKTLGDKIPAFVHFNKGL